MAAISSPPPTPIWAGGQRSGEALAGNNLACGNCHLEAGTKRFGLPVFGLYGDFPHYSARAGAEITVEERVNSCVTRSMNGRAIPGDAPEMSAFVAYIKFLSTGVPPDQRIPGLGAGNIPELHRAADPTRGRASYVAKCAGCHNTDGSGIRRSLPTTDLGYLVPPLWGADSFNDGAGMDRLITAANFVHSNMPQGADYLNPVLSTVDAWDVAAFVVSQPRPDKSGLEKDFPISRSSRSIRRMGRISTALASAAQIRTVCADPRGAGALEVKE